MAWSAFQLRAMAAALNRAADRIEQEAQLVDFTLQRRRKPHRDDLPAVSATLHKVARQLRQWAKLCSPMTDP
jgi:hypothetical protein